MQQGQRDAVGRRSGLVGLVGNLMLVLIKSVIGWMSGSVAITADAVNNLTDCVSSLVTLFGFSASAREKDRVHPYGHGRMEYICGFLVSLLVLATGVWVGKDAVMRLAAPQPVTVTALTAVAVAVGIAGKLCMAGYVYSLNQTVHSPALKAVQKDDLSDALVTAVTLAGILAAPYLRLPVDSILGMVVSVVILKSGVDSLNENLLLLLGEGADPVTKEEILRIIARYAPAWSVEEICLHDYGPENRLAYIKIRLTSGNPTPCDALELDAIRQTLRQELQIDATLYWDIPLAAC